jgi:thiol-disulfide isomerase/thioredoxin
MNEPADTVLRAPLTVACLCAEWCGTCRGYRAVFEQAVQTLQAAGLAGRWIDVEDEADLVGAIDVDNFPTLLIARGDEVLFFGTITPHPSTLTRLMQAALDGQAHLGGEAPDADVRLLAARLQSDAR